MLEQQEAGSGAEAARPGDEDRFIWNGLTMMPDVIATRAKVRYHF